MQVKREGGNHPTNIFTGLLASPPLAWE
jgi:hypothetical protein